MPPGRADSSSAAPAAEPTTSDEMTAEQLREAKEYGRLGLLASLADKLADAVFLGIMAFVFAIPLDRWLSQSISGDSVRLLVLFAVLMLLHLAVSFPISLYSGYVLEHRFGLSRQTFGRWFFRYAKSSALMILFGAVLVSGLYAVIWAVGTWWWLAAAGVFFVVTIVVGQWMPVVVLPLFYKIERINDPELTGRMTRLAEGTGLSIEGVYRLGLSQETAKANAMLAGMGRTRRVLMGDTLLDQFTPDEIEVIFAHEIGHHVFRHIHKMILVGVLYSLLGFWICNQALVMWTAAHYGQPVDLHNLPVSTLPLFMFVMTLFSLALEPLQNIVSRHYERQCDRYALARTGMRAAYLSAFRKLARLNKDDPAPHALEVFLFHSHPPIAERLMAAGE